MPTGLADAPKTGFWIAQATTAHAKSSVEVQLFPQPTFVEYPNTYAGDPQETADGRVVLQFSNLDPRRRAWHWSNFGPSVATYERQYQFLRSLKSRERHSRGQSPYVYVYDGTSDELGMLRSIEFAGAALSSTVASVADFSSIVHPDFLANAWLEVLPATASSSAAEYQRRRVMSAIDTSTLLLEEAFTTDDLASSNLLLTWAQPAWFRVRVVDVVRELRQDGGPVRYGNTVFAFIVDDTASPYTLDSHFLSGSGSTPGAFSSTAFSSTAFSPAAFDGV